MLSFRLYDKFKAIKPKKGKSVQQVSYERAFAKLIEEIEVPLFEK